MDRPIARFNEKVTVQKCSVQADRYGNHMNVWEDYFTCHAYASTYTKEESERTITSDERSVNFEVRYCSELKDINSTSYRILFHGDAYNIASVDMMNYQRRTIRLLCRKEKRGGGSGNSEG